MKYPRYFMSMILLCLWSPLAAQINDLNQQVFASSGDSAEGGGVHLSWTIGEAIVTTEAGGGITLQQGFQQGLDDVSAGWPVRLDEVDLALPVEVYPNPVRNHVWIETGEAANLTLEVYDLQGRLLTSQTEFVGPGNRLELSTIDWAEGTYYLGVTSSTHSGRKSFTLIKH